MNRFALAMARRRVGALGDGGGMYDGGARMGGAYRQHDMTSGCSSGSSRPKKYNRWQRAVMQYAKTTKIPRRPGEWVLHLRQYLHDNPLPQGVGCEQHHINFAQAVKDAKATYRPKRDQKTWRQRNFR